MKASLPTLTSVSLCVSLAAFAPAVSAATRPAGSYTYSGSMTFVSQVNGAVTTTTQQLDVPLYYSLQHEPLPSVPINTIQGSGYVSDEPPRPPPPGDLPRAVGSVTLKIDNGQMTRVTTYTRTVTKDSSAPEGVNDGPWTMSGDTMTQDAGAGGGGCNMKTSSGQDCPALN